MIYSRTTEYAMNALVYLAGESTGSRSGVQEMARSLEIPVHFLGKIMQDLRKGELVQAFRGRNGGYRLALPPAEIALYDVVSVIEDLDKYETCIFGMKECRSGLSCALICDWNQVKNQITEFLRSHSIADLLQVHPYWLEHGNHDQTGEER
ncbi:MAG TPA: Rrf2 family transcriptional regulator [bacterium]|nr:Rrf2 family transcriptional regulator [bacterium]